jgi:hypothetical protein
MARYRRIIAKLKPQAVASRFCRQRIGEGGIQRGVLDRHLCRS